MREKGEYVNPDCRRLEKELEEQRLFTESIVRSLSSGLIVLDPDGNISILNPEGKRIFSHLCEDINSIKKIEEIVGASAAAVMTDIRDNTLFFRNEITLKSPKGEKTIGYTTVPRLTSEGAMAGKILSFRDITEIRAMRHEMEKINRYSTMAEIASAVAHEIRNPLAGIKTMAQSIDENIAEDDENKEYITRIVKQVDRLNEILKGFFTYARPARPVISNTPLEPIIRDVKYLVQHKLKSSRIHFAENYETSLPCIFADQNQIQQVFLNLVLNSIDAVKKDGTIELRACLHSGGDFRGMRSFPHLQRDKEYVRVELQDQGCGMKKEVADRIFEPFFTTKAYGSGLGLSIVYRLLKENNASIFVDTAEGQGTTFITFFETGDHGHSSDYRRQ